MDNLWIERYRPTTLDDICLSKDIKDLIVSWGNEIPHLLLIGNPGVGKTTLAQILVKNVLDCDYLYINASDENGIDTIRNKVTGFVQTKSLDGNIKVVVLDESDGMSLEGQRCLRNLMESYANTARFILTGNHRHKISNALQSRCQRLDIVPSLKESVLRCIKILECEKIEVTPEQTKNLIRLVKRFHPDLRRCIGEMGRNCVGGKLNIQEKNDTSQLLELIWKNILSNKSISTRKHLIENGEIFNSDWDQLLIDLLNHIYTQPIEDSMKKAMIITIADHLEKSSRVIDKEINFFACLLNLE
jgi:replication-associated recombination protein RarA